MYKGKGRRLRVRGILVVEGGDRFWRFEALLGVRIVIEYMPAFREKEDREGEGVAVVGGEGVDEFADGDNEEELALDTFGHIIVQYIGFPFL